MKLTGVQHTGTFASQSEEMSLTRIVPVTKNLPLVADFAQDCHASRNPWPTQLNVFPRPYDIEFGGCWLVTYVP